MLGIGLKISNSSIVQTIALIVATFKARVLTDGGTFEGEANLLNQNLANINAASFVYVPSAYKATKLYALKGTDLTNARNSVAYRNNASNVLEQMAANVGRIHYVNGVPTLLMEPVRTNTIRNNSMVGAVVGSPGSLPTNWTAAGVPWQVVGLGTENGLAYIDIRFNGVASGVSNQIHFEPNNVITASVGQVWASSLYFKIIAAPIPPNNYNTRLREATSSGTFVADGVAAFTPNSQLQRFTYIRTNTGATTERIQPMLQLGQTNGNSYDYTIRIASPQLELGATDSSIITTAGTTVTRVADTNSVSRVFTQNQTVFQTIYLNAGSLADNTAYTIYDIRVSGAVRITLYRFNNAIYADIVNTSVAGGLIYNLPTLVQNTVYKTALVVTATGFKFFVNGALVFTSAVFAMPNLTTATMSIGCFTTGILQWNGSLGENYIYDYTMTDAEAILRTT